MKPGYKQTEVGVIPEDWRLQPIGQVVHEFRGGAPLKPSDFQSSGVKVLPKGGVGYGGRLKIREKDLQFCADAYAASHPRNQVDETFTIVVLRDLVPSGPSIGLMVQIKEPESYVLAQGVYGFKTNANAAPGYLVQLSNTAWYRKLVNSIMVGSTQVHITNTAFKLAEIPLPPIAEQNAIAEALSDADALIESLAQLLAKKRDLKQGAMQQLLTGKRRLPGFAEKWDLRHLADVIERFVGGGTPSRVSPDFWGGPIPWVTVKDFATFSPYTAQESITAAGLKSSASSLIPAGVLITSTRMALGKAVIYQVDVAINQDLKALFVKPVLDTQFLYYWFESKQDMIDGLGSGSTVKGLSLGDLKAIEILLPPKTEQTAIAKVLADADAEISIVETRLAKARQLKQGMMQELLTGRIRLI